MKYVKFGATGLDVSKICLGMMSFGQPGEQNGLFPWAKDFDAGKETFKKAIELGINFFDTANVYQMGSSEEITGQYIKAFNLNRDEIVVASKVNFAMRPNRPNGGGLSRKNIMTEIDHSLKRLQLDYLDVYQIHRLDHSTPYEETMEALHDVVKSGKVRYLGASSMHAWEFERLQNIAEKNNWTKFVSMQNHYSLIHREEEREMIPLCVDRKVAMIPWSPLAGGRLTRPWQTATDRSKIDNVSPMVWGNSEDLDKVIVDNVETLAKKRGISMAQLSLAWMLSKPFITSPIIGTTSPHHIDEAVKALDITLNDDEIEFLEQSYKPHPVLSVF
ncbi:aldo/keto reductase [Bartonella sp. HY761]|uniref:aldo/keto reductase n=1 Tax=Bartonella sp. HY761 TaxID=2979330 RepID=UPI0022064F59|nr:aldo/keto reductase [Bartonella sp. HY761]UXN06094.1 aldo/keto reductase [Bartonella sp. HY761]